MTDTKHPVGTIQVGEGLGAIITEHREPTREARIRGESLAAYLAAEYLKSAFRWSTSPEGLDFWADIYERLDEISRDLYDHAETLRGPALGEAVH